MGTVRGTQIREHAIIVAPNGQIFDGSIWRIDGSEITYAQVDIIFAEVEGGCYALDLTKMNTPGTFYLRSDEQGDPILQGLPPDDEEYRAMKAQRN